MKLPVYLAAIFALAWTPNVGSAATKLPTEDEIRGIQALCGGGISERIKGDVAGKLSLWKREAQASGEGSVDRLVALLSQVPNKIDPTLWAVYTKCAVDLVSAYIKSSAVPRPPANTAPAIVLSSKSNAVSNNGSSYDYIESIDLDNHGGIIWATDLYAFINARVWLHECNAPSSSLNGIHFSSPVIHESDFIPIDSGYSWRFKQSASHIKEKFDLLARPVHDAGLCVAIKETGYFALFFRDFSDSSGSRLAMMEEGIVSPISREEFNEVSNWRHEDESQNLVIASVRSKATLTQFFAEMFSKFPKEEIINVLRNGG